MVVLKTKTLATAIQAHLKIVMGEGFNRKYFLVTLCFYRQLITDY